MQSTPGSFYWSEDLDESLNYWFWLRRVEGLAGELLVARVHRLLRQTRFDRYREVQGERRRAEYLRFWAGWKRQQIEAQLEHSRTSTPWELKAQYEAVAAVGLAAYEVQWVAAPLGERWLFPPDAAVRGWKERPHQTAGPRFWRRLGRSAGLARRSLSAPSER